MPITRMALQRLKDADWLRDAETRGLFALLDGAQGRTRAVGGAVRDTLTDRQRERADLDFATELLPEEVMARAKTAGIAAYPTGIEHGTVTLRGEHLVAEVTTLREDVDTDGRHAVVKFGTDWTRDAQRRDFTLNALYVGADGELFDPLGGAEDCLAGRVRFIGNAAERIREDRLRVYRFFRFSASHGNEHFDEVGLTAVTRAAGDLDELSAERVGFEMRRMLSLPRVSKTLRAMVVAGVLSLPGETLERLGDFEKHSRRPDFVSRLALILSNTNAPPVRDMWRLSNEDVARAKAILSAAALLMDFDLHEAAYRFPAALAEAVDAAAVIAGWTEAGKDAVLEQLQGIDVPMFPLNGSDLVEYGIAPGPALGDELDRLERRWIASGFKLDRESLLAEVKL